MYILLDMVFISRSKLYLDIKNYNFYPFSPKLFVSNFFFILSKIHHWESDSQIYSLSGSKSGFDILVLILNKPTLLFC